MSREFGEYHRQGYIHAQIKGAQVDCEGGTLQLTRAIGCLFSALDHPIYALASAEAGDWGEDAYARAVLRAMPNLRAQLDHVESVAKETSARNPSRIREVRAAALAKLNAEEIAALGVAEDDGL